MQARVVPVVTYFADNEKHGIWGGTFGLGASHDWNRWFSTFIEYDYYGYASRALRSYTNIFNNPASIFARSDFSRQNVQLHSYAVRAGANIKFNF